MKKNNPTEPVLHKGFTDREDAIITATTKQALQSFLRLVHVPRLMISINKILFYYLRHEDGFDPNITCFFEDGDALVDFFAVLMEEYDQSWMLENLTEIRGGRTGKNIKD